VRLILRQTPAAKGGIMASNKHEHFHVHEGQITIQTPSIDSMMREVLHLLGNIDFEHEIQLQKLENSNTDQELKSHISKKIRAAHRERREPYLELLATLRQRQQRLSLSH
jgi:glycosylphosphatidylinositol transamidase (GPIT) subunit GPI8